MSPWPCAVVGSLVPQEHAQRGTGSRPRQPGAAVQLRDARTASVCALHVLFAIVIVSNVADLKLDRRRPASASTTTLSATAPLPVSSQPGLPPGRHGRQTRLTVRSSVDSQPAICVAGSRQTGHGCTSVASAIGYFTATSSAIRMFGSPARRSGATSPRAWGIGPARCASRASSVLKVSKMP